MDRPKVAQSGPKPPNDTTKNPHFDAAVEVFGEALDLIGPNLKSRQPESSNLSLLAKLIDVQAEDHLHHYTNADGLQGIVERIASTRVPLTTSTIVLKLTMVVSCSLTFSIRG
jgi:hypothetical protein